MPMEDRQSLCTAWASESDWMHEHVDLANLGLYGLDHPAGTMIVQPPAGRSHSRLTEARSKTVADGDDVPLVWPEKD